MFANSGTSTNGFIFGRASSEPSVAAPNGSNNAASNATNAVDPFSFTSSNATAGSASKSNEFAFSGTSAFGAFGSGASSFGQPKPAPTSGAVPAANGMSTKAPVPAIFGKGDPGPAGSSTGPAKSATPQRPSPEDARHARDKPTSVFGQKSKKNPVVHLPPATGSLFGGSNTSGFGSNAKQPATGSTFTSAFGATVNQPATGSTSGGTSAFGSAASEPAAGLTSGGGTTDVLGSATGLPAAGLLNVFGQQRFTLAAPASFVPAKPQQVPLDTGAGASVSGGTSAPEQSKFTSGLVSAFGPPMGTAFDPSKLVDIEALVRKSLLGDELVNTQFHLFSTRSLQSERVTKPRVLCANNAILARTSKYFVDLLSSDISPSDLSLVDLTGDNDVPGDALFDDYGYDSDSDLEDCDEPEVTEDGDKLSRSDSNVPPPDESVTNPEGGNDKKLGNRAAVRLRSLESRHILVKDTAFRTWYTLLNYLYTGRFGFLPLSSATPSRHHQPLESLPDLPRCSAKSMYRLASKVELDELRDEAFSYIRRHINEHNVLKEISCSLVSKYPRLLEMELDVLYAHIGSPPVVADFTALAKRVGSGELPHGADIMNGIHQRLLKERFPYSFAGLGVPAMPLPSPSFPSPSPLPLPSSFGVPGASESTKLDVGAGKHETAASLHADKQGATESGTAVSTSQPDGKGKQKAVEEDKGQRQ